MADYQLFETLASALAVMSGIKTLYGWTCLAGCLVLLLFLLYEVEPVRSTFKKMPSWRDLGRKLYNYYHA